VGGQTYQGLRDFDRNYFSGPIGRFLYGGDNSLSRFFRDYVGGRLPPLPPVNEDAVRRFHQNFGKPIEDQSGSFRPDPAGMAELARILAERDRRQPPQVNTGPINVTVNVAGSNADPGTIGNAAGNAVRDRLCSLLADPAWSGPSPH
jgi:hypothetical protein